MGLILPLLGIMASAVKYFQDSFTAIANYPSSVASGGQAFGIYNGSIYTWGAYQTNGFVYAYNILGNSWSNPYNSMPSGFMSWGCQNLNTNAKIYGYQCGNTISSGGNGNATFYYDAINTAYTTLANTPTTGRRGRGTTNPAGTIGYYHSGFTSGPSQGWYSYSVSGNSYTSQTNFPVSSYDIGIAHDGTNSNIYAINAQGSLTFYVYSVSGNTWTTKTAPTNNNAGMGTVLGTKIYYTGNTSNYMSIYDIGGNTWSYGTHTNSVAGASNSSITNDGTNIYIYGNDTVNAYKYQP